MTWFRTDDDFTEHVKMDALEKAAGTWEVYAAARTVWHDLGCDCARRRTDGAFLRSRVYRVVRLIPAPTLDAALVALVASGFIDAPAPDSYQFHDWADYQPTKAEQDAEKKAKSERQSRWRARLKTIVDASTAPSQDASRDAPKDATVDPPGDGDGDASRRRVADDGGSARVDAAPSHPVPSLPVSETPDTSAVGGATAPPPAAGNEAHPTAKREAPTLTPMDDPEPLAGTPAAVALAALRKCPTLLAITDRPARLAVTITAGAYPAVDVSREVLAAEVWLVANPRNQKKNGARFLGSWLANAQERAPRVVTPHPPQPAPRPVVPAATAPQPVRFVRMTAEEKASFAPTLDEATARFAAEDAAKARAAHGR